MATLRISFLIRAVYDLLHSNTNLVRWGMKITHMPIVSRQTDNRACSQFLQSNSEPGQSTARRSQGFRPSLRPVADSLATVPLSPPPSSPPHAHSPPPVPKEEED
ncbi:hypothetical protein PoB_000843700 [Plakobranchus ocellatus]|uniref:Uncharacterized protein n=1 Tax=Plakobranchus ocellatus TaxID=259542 RepID=A0AAV3YGE4_9GAST|nr:hypothetical protein PoB_000843700 [Plakobranchus ocellatus]